jgi:hypothetical protein
LSWHAPKLLFFSNFIKLFLHQRPQLPIIKNPPKIDQSSPNETFIFWPNGNKTSLKLEGSTIKAEHNPVGGSPWSGTFFREKEKQ